MELELTDEELLLTSPGREEEAMEVGHREAEGARGYEDLEVMGHSLRHDAGIHTAAHEDDSDGEVGAGTADPPAAGREQQRQRPKGRLECGAAHRRPEPDGGVILRHAPPQLAAERVADGGAHGVEGGEDADREGAHEVDDSSHRPLAVHGSTAAAVVGRCMGSFDQPAAMGELLLPTVGVVSLPLWI